MNACNSSVIDYSNCVRINMKLVQSSGVFICCTFLLVCYGHKTDTTLCVSCYAEVNAALCFDMCWS